MPTSDTWFEVFRIFDGVYAIYEPGQFEEVISWLITGEQGALLFDTGLGIGDIRGLTAELTRLPVTVLNSHTHYDHVGGNFQFDTLLSREHAYAMARSAGLGNDKVGEYALGDWIWKPVPPGFDAATFSTQAWQVSRRVDEGEFIDLGGVSLEIIDSPGHSPDGVVLVDYQRRLMFTGDTFYKAPLYAHIPGADVSAYASSAAKLAALADSVDYLLMGHNTPRADASYLTQLHAAFQAILDGSAEYTVGADGREYDFGDFGLLTPDPPVPGKRAATQ